MILVIAAMPEEVTALNKKMSEVEEKKLFNTRFYQGKIADKTVLLAQSGVGKVNAAITASTLMAQYPIDYCINIGSAGGLQKGQNIGDIVLSTILQYHDFDIGEETIVDPRFIFYADETLNQNACEVLEDLNLPYHQGQVVAGDQFVTKSSAAFARIQEKFPQALAVDMESTAIAATASRFKVPFIVLRGLSDVTFVEGNELTFETYLELASERSATICEGFIKKEFAF